MKILQINTTDIRGGAARVAYDLKKELIKRGNSVKMLVGEKFSNDDDVFCMRRNNFKRFSALSKKIIKKDLPGFIINNAKNNFRKLIANDIEFFSGGFLKHKYFKEADIIHCHNLHGNYFNLALLKEISRLKPVIWTLHDMWAVTGHCAWARTDNWSSSCDKWKTGCVNCGDLRIYEEIFWDNCKYLWKKKKQIYENSKLHIALPSLWLKEIIDKSILSSESVELIYNGIEIDNFKKTNKLEARRNLNLPADKKIILYLANGGQNNAQKGWLYIQAIAGLYNSENYLFICIGGEAPDIQRNIKFIKYERDKQKVAQYYCAADIFLFTSMAENFPLTVLESMACGTPIVSFDVGGVKEAVLHKQNGYIAKYGDEADLIRGIEWIFSLDSGSLTEMSHNSIERIRENFSLDLMAKNYYNLYQKIINE